MQEPTPFYRAPPDEQIRRLADLAQAALPQWRLEGADVTPVAYRENMTFRVDAPRRGAFAFRVHQANYRTDAQIQSELDLMAYLNTAGILTPVVVPTTNGSLFTTVANAGVPEPRQCDLFEWIEGKPLRQTGEAFSTPLPELEQSYREVGRLAASIHNALERWDRPAGFERPPWDCEGLFGVNGHLGDFRRLTDVTEGQQRLLLDVAAKLAEVMTAFGQTPDRYGLSHGDFLAENIFVCDDGIRLLDFDDAGDSWYLFDLTTAVFDLLDSPAFEPCMAAIVSGYRELRPLPEEHLAMLPAFGLARVLSYLGWCAKKAHMPQTAWMRPLLLSAAEKHGANFLRA
ncbi:MAG: phosphotransferase [Chloroflexota bacterium]